ncbi:MAG: hypothetical protein KKC75_05455 [Nanoarchaeota archaeon]|nr:hypothetical protein [Nanoarchaeota archaeon]MBU1005007.1 hypothetical protein [Nanoarchaeota archaeon]MBU1945899.1 hypothetical protein [Nanoarchaeota archaeon]
MINRPTRLMDIAALAAALFAAGCAYQGSQPQSPPQKPQRLYGAPQYRNITSEEQYNRIIAMQKRWEETGVRNDGLHGDYSQGTDGAAALIKAGAILLGP